MTLWEQLLNLQLKKVVSLSSLSLSESSQLIPSSITLASDLVRELICWKYGFHLQHHEDNLNLEYEQLRKKRIAEKKKKLKNKENKVHEKLEHIGRGVQV